MNTELATTRGEKMIEFALQNNATPETLEKLLALQERWERNEARKVYTEAMAAFKAEAPAVLNKDAKVDFTTAKGRTSFTFASLGGIVQQITVLLSKYGLSVSWNTNQMDSNAVSVTCHITHVLGHRESITLKAPPDQSGNKTRYSKSEVR